VKGKKIRVEGASVGNFCGQRKTYQSSGQHGQQKEALLRGWAMWDRKKKTGETKRGGKNSETHSSTSKEDETRKKPKEFVFHHGREKSSQPEVTAQVSQQQERINKECSNILTKKKVTLDPVER